MSQNRANKLRMRRQAKKKQPTRPYSRHARERAARLSENAFGLRLPFDLVAPITPLLSILTRRGPR